MNSRSILALLLTVSTVLSQAPLEVSGLADKQIFMDSVSFRVHAAVGYSYEVFLDGQRIPADLTLTVDEMDYHELLVQRTHAASGAVTNRLIRFIVLHSDRGTPERGMVRWTPLPPIPSSAEEIAGSELKLVAPREFPTGLPIPIIASVKNPDGQINRVNGHVVAETHAGFPVYRGHGFGFLPPGTAGTLQYAAEFQEISASRDIELKVADWMKLSGVLPENTVWPANARIHLTNNLTIPSGGSLNIEAGAVVMVNPGVNITNNGRITISGTLEQPVVFTAAGEVRPHEHTLAWGGFLLRGEGSQLTATGAIFTGSGAVEDFEFSPGASHRSEQALLLVHSGAKAFLTNCFLISHAGQIGNGYDSEMVFDNCLIQRAITAGEYEDCRMVINRSAVIEFPSVDGIYDKDIVEADYDAIYFTEGRYLLRDSLFGFCKDDAVDAGSGDDGTVLMENCWVESALHEALAWSGGGRITDTLDTVLMNSGQGIEAGYTRGFETSPICFAERILATGNGVGIRFGDNYDWNYLGFLRVTNSLSIYNYRDVFAKTWNPSNGSSWDTNSWVDRLRQIDLQSNFFSKIYPEFPGNHLWQTEGNPSRLSHWMTTSVDAVVGAGFGLWTNRLSYSESFRGIPVRLSSFTTRPVTVLYTLQKSGAVLARGALEFSPGETVRRIVPHGFIPPADEIELKLADGEGTAVTGLSVLRLTGTVPPPQLAIASSEAQSASFRLVEGVPLQLSHAYTIPITARYRYAGSDGTIRTGEVTFAPGETLAWAASGGIDSSVVRFEIISASNVNLGNTELHFVETVEPPGPFNIIAWGSLWKYNDTGSNLGTSWRTPEFNHTAWAEGRGQLGFGDNDETTTIRRTRASDGTGIVTFYFRKEVTLDDREWINASMSILRDDGAIVYVNGREVYRSANMPAGSVTYTTRASSTAENTIDKVLIPGTDLRPGRNVVAVEVHQESSGSSDLSFEMELIGSSGVPTAPTLRAVVFEPRMLTFTWSDPRYLLESSTDLGGTWQTAAGSSPATFSLIEDRQFFRLRKISLQN